MILELPEVQFVAVCDPVKDSQDYVDGSADGSRAGPAKVMGRPDWRKNRPGTPGGREVAKQVIERVYATATALLLASLAALHAADVPPASLARDSGPAANLLQNPSFEKTAGDGVEGWTSRAWAGKEATRWSVETPGRTGERCVSIESAKGADAAWTAMVSVQPGAWYRLSGWIKTNDVRGAAGALLNIQNMQDVWTRAVSGTRDWMLVETVFQAGAAPQLEINCLFGGWGSSTGQAWYDDVVLEHVAEPADETRAVVAIDTDAPCVLYSPMIFGGFLEHFNNQVYGGVFEPDSPLADKNGLRRDVLAALKELNVSIVRWPGGCYVSGYRWEAGVGKERMPTDDMAWGVVEPNTFGTDEYVEICRTLGWTPYICNNAGNGTVEEMRNWVEYCNGRSVPVPPYPCSAQVGNPIP